MAAVEALLAGAPVDAAQLERAREAIAEAVDPGDDIHASAECRREAAAELATAALAEA
jgi:carbon-monoxide dehydrogenase medium subunit